MTPPDLAALAREYATRCGWLMREPSPVAGNWRKVHEEDLTRAFIAFAKEITPTIATLSRTAGRAEGLEERDNLRRNLNLAQELICDHEAVLAEARGMSDMLTLCGEEECCDVEGLPQKLRALIDGLIEMRRQRDDAATQAVRECARADGLRDLLDQAHTDLLAAKLFAPVPDTHGFGRQIDRTITAIRALASDPAPGEQVAAWPVGCSHPNSCARHQFCGYLRCVHAHRSIASEIVTAKKATPAHPTEPGEVERLARELNEARQKLDLEHSEKEDSFDDLATALTGLDIYRARADILTAEIERLRAIETAAREYRRMAWDQTPFKLWADAGLALDAALSTPQPKGETE